MYETLLKEILRCTAKEHEGGDTGFRVSGSGIGFSVGFWVLGLGFRFPDRGLI